MTRWSIDAIKVLQESYPQGVSCASAALAGAGFPFTDAAIHLKAHRLGIRCIIQGRPPVEIGALTIGASGYQYISVPLDYPFIKGRGKIGKGSILYYHHYYCWEQQHQQEIPDGHRLYFKDGDQLNCHIDNLVTMTLSDYAKQNAGAQVNQAYWLKKYGSLSALYATPDLELVYNKHGKLIWKKI